MKLLTLDPDKHVHNLSKISLMRIQKVQERYAGTTGDKAMLIRLCVGDECPEYEAFEFGDYNKMLAKYKDLTGKNWRAKSGGHNTISITSETDE